MDKNIHKIKIFQKKITYKDSSEVFGSGIDEECIENPGDLEDILKGYVCIVCLEIIKLPYQCSNCESLYCCDCFDILKTQNKDCVLKCNQSKIQKAGKFVNNFLKNLYVKCNQCNKKTDYITFVKHLDACQINQKFFSRNEFKNIIRDQDEKIESLANEIKSLKEKRDEKKKEKDSSKKDQLKKQVLNNPEIKEIRAELLQNTLSSSQKSAFQKCANEGKYPEFIEHVFNDGFPILEEISPVNYYWTAIHYAMYYGHLEIVKFCFSMLESQDLLEKAMQLFTSDGRCPILCLLTNSLNLDQKKKFMSDLLLNFPDLKISDFALIEMKKRGMDYLIIDK